MVYSLHKLFSVSNYLKEFNMVALLAISLQVTVPAVLMASLPDGCQPSWSVVSVDCFSVFK